jgi:hypothetical protein
MFIQTRLVAAFKLTAGELWQGITVVSSYIGKLGYHMVCYHILRVLGVSEQDNLRISLDDVLVAVVPHVP